MQEELIVIMCPPLSEYPEAPKDQPQSELFNCPKCKNKMWLSKKKKGLLLFYSCANKDILLACYLCIMKEARENPDFFTNAERLSNEIIKS